ncbi:Protein tyrosine kinase domain-containing protein [Entamoeba marina]
MLFFLIQFLVIIYAYTCTSGCLSGCVADYTCLTCSNGFDDNYCSHCITTDVSTEGIVYLPNNSTCEETSNIVSKTHWVPDGAPELIENETTSFSFDSSTPIDFGPCHHAQRFRLAKWFFIDTTMVTSDNIIIQLDRVNGDNVDVYIDISTSSVTTPHPDCYGRSILPENNITNTIKLPIAFIAVQTEKRFYVFVSIDGVSEVDLNITLLPESGKSTDPYFVLTDEMAEELSQDLSKSISVTFPLSYKSDYGYPICAKNMLIKVLLFRITVSGNYSIRINVGSSNFMYIQEYGIDWSSAESGKFACYSLWDNNLKGIMYESRFGTSGSSLDNVFDDMSPSFRVKGNASAGERYFALMSEEHNKDFTIEFSAYCPNNCNNELGYGNCFNNLGNCRCNDGYGGDDCHLLCYYNNEWQPSSNDGNNQCYYGTDNCDSYCGCENGYELKGHYCVSTACEEGNDDGTNDCLLGSEGCLPNCHCGDGFSVSNTTKCVADVCGNGKIDTYNDIDGSSIIEECDSGLNCNQYCRCYEGFVPDPDNPGNCYKEPVSVGLIVGIAVLGVLFFVIILVVFVVFVIFATRFKPIDKSIYLQQQPNYHLYLGGSSNQEPTKETKYFMEPIQLDFGNLNESTKIFDTRFERISIKNRSKKKWMMVIFHTPNTPKYVYHFEPQVVYVRPHQTVLKSCYMTLFCTTKVRGMKIPYTVWLSKKKSYLTSIASLLEGKTFDKWTDEYQKNMEKYLKNITYRCHHHLTISTDAASSTFLDMDELNMKDEPIAEGAMGRVYIGKYRSVPIAIKQFRWENLTKEETEDLKKEVVNECELMGKLRNPFIANYMGSVTYIPQISMVIQFFVLGSLGEYLRQSSVDYIKLPIKLKTRMLFDMSRGMEFLHENKIMHLDLKPDNLLVNSLYSESPCCVKITDFGTSRFTKKTLKSQDKGLGTPIYAAPETYNDEYTFAGDVYAFAITTWEIFYQDEPYKEFKSLFEIKNHVQSGRRLTIDETMPPKLKDLIQTCWIQNIDDRPSFNTISKMIVDIVDECAKREDLDVGVSYESIKDLIEKRTQRMAEQLDDL